MTPLCNVQPSKISTFKKTVFQIFRKIILQSWLHSTVNDNAGPRTFFYFSPRFQSCIQKGFNQCVRGLGGVVW
jgi:hypothetical protein